MVLMPCDSHGELSESCDLILHANGFTWTTSWMWAGDLRAQGQRTGHHSHSESGVTFSAVLSSLSSRRAAL